ncbi:hypothetical protein EDD36DRAFT_451991 [Exophiala viscosa]|uniref:F-box domain-containing protein n=1 Tax=Exophiala viscosa TaxID=2486360 RepID=A0AAN6DYB3_9EURO|nr:hypothetical protein EDD36DRAFT_451991 [Exophiala viscosa]
MDGASDSPDETPSPARSRASSHSIVRSNPARLWRVRFLSVEDLRSRQSSTSQADEGSLKRDNDQFTNPFGNEQTPLSSRHSSSSDATAYLRPNAFAGHRDTLARLSQYAFVRGKYVHGHIEPDGSAFASVDLTQQPRLHLSISRKRSSVHADIFLPQPIVDADYKALRLVCRQRHVSLSLPRFPAILQHIYSYLSLCDFDAARHTCRSWLLASLDKNVQEPLLRSSGSESALTADIQWLTESDNQREDLSRSSSPFEDENQVVVNKEWVCSKRLATESRLSPEWRGSPPSDTSGSIPRLWLMEEDALSGRTRFTVSICGKFVLVVSQTDISLYSLCEPEQSVAPVVRLAAGLEVLKRFSVAALLSGRLGMLWDLLGEPLNLGLQTYVQGSATFSPRGPRSSEWSVEDEELLAAEPPAYSATPPAVLSGSSSTGFDETPERDDLEENDAEDDEGSDHVGLGIPIETRATAVYTDLGSPDDLPRSVAICPNRKCVAFGCRMGIELHWIDAVTGGSLNRWFPLAAPSDHLYFLPQRLGIDSRKKLRLISSAAGPVAPQLLRSDSSPAIWKYWPMPAAHGRRQSLTRLFFGNLPFPTSASPSSRWPRSSTRAQSDEVQGVLRTVDCDHFRAIPVSDGSHVIFTDPSNGLLCLGSDAPLGGPTKLIRKVVFAPPPHPEGTQCSPIRYTAGKALPWGLRIVAVYDDGQVVLYNIPADLFKRMQDLHTSADVWDETSGVIGQSDLLMDSWMTSHPNASIEPQTGNEAANSSATSASKPLQISCATLFTVEDDFVDDLAVQTDGGGLSLWVFYRIGRAERYSIYSPRGHQKTVKLVGENGLVYDGNDSTKQAKGKEKAKMGVHEAGDRVKRNEMSGR